MNEPFRLNRGRALQLPDAGSLATFATMPAIAHASPLSPPDPVAATHHRVLLRHTRWAEQQFDKSTGARHDLPALRSGGLGRERGPPRF